MRFVENQLTSPQQEGSLCIARYTMKSIIHVSFQSKSLLCASQKPIRGQGARTLWHSESASVAYAVRPEWSDRKGDLSTYHDRERAIGMGSKH